MTRAIWVGWIFIGLLAVGLSTGCKTGPAQPEAGFLAAEESWRADRDRELRAKDSWLTIAGLFWLSEGENTFGTAASNAIVLPAGSASEKAGIFILNKGVFSVKALPGVLLTVNGRPAETAVLKDESQGKVDVVGLKSLWMWIIKRDLRFAIRLRDTNHPALKSFTKLEYFPASAEFRITGEFHPFPKPEVIRVEAKIVGTTEMTAVGRVTFVFKSEKYEIEAWQGETAGTIHFVLGDTTNGRNLTAEDAFSIRLFWTAGRSTSTSIVFIIRPVFSPPTRLVPSLRPPTVFRSESRPGRKCITAPVIDEVRALGRIKAERDSFSDPCPAYRSASELIWSGQFKIKHAGY